MHLTVFAREGALLVEQVSLIAANEKWSVTEIYAEAGRLDEVFRKLTTHETARTGEAA